MSLTTVRAKVKVVRPCVSVHCHRFYCSRDYPLLCPVYEVVRFFADPVLYRHAGFGWVESGRSLR